MATVDGFLSRCMEKLIDLSKRNRFLNFRAGKGSAVRIVDEKPVEIWKILFASSQSMRFLPKRATEEPRLERETALIERHRDRNLQADLEEDALDKSLLRLFQQSRATLEEQGYNTLYLALGFLEWFETKQDPEPLQAPLLLVPVTLERKTVAAPFVLKAYDDDPVVNPALARKLQTDFKISLPWLPEDLETFDPKAWFDDVTAAIAGDPRWKVNDQVALAMFSFAKFAMYRDLDENRAAFTAEARAAAMAGTMSWPKSPTPIPEKPDLDREFAAPERFLVVDADSSQQETILAAATGTDLVVEGPPGTGKSQTITNLIAEFLGAGKSVLFVSEKMAALEVVYDRLKRVGLGDFCLEMHSRNASKKRVVEELRRTLETVRTKRPEDEATTKQLADVRAKLVETMALLHGAVAPLGKSPYDAVSFLASRPELADAGVPVAGAETWTGDQLVAQVKRVVAFSEAMASVSPRASHPWRGATITDAPYELTLKLKEALAELLTRIAPAQAAGKALADAMGAAGPARADGLDRLVDLGVLLTTSPGPDPALLDRDFPPDAADFIGRVAAYRDKMRALREGYRDEILDASLIDAKDAYLRYGDAWYRLFVGRWRAARNLLRTHAKPGWSVRGLADVALASEAQVLRKAIGEFDAARAFGTAWKGPETDPGPLTKLAEWLPRWRRHVAEKRVTDRVRQLANGGLASDPVERAKRAAQALNDAIVNVRTLAGLKPERLWDGPPLFETLSADAKAMLDGIERLAEWARYIAAMDACEAAGVGPFLSKAVEKNVPTARLAEAYQCQFYRTWLDAVVRRLPALATFDGRAADKLVAQFRELDVRQMEITRARLVNRLVANLPDTKWEASETSELGILQHECRKKRAHLPIRKLLTKTQHALRRMKPCLLMSPLTVAMFLDPKEFKADVVIFDEASQISPEDAVGAIARGRQLIVVGDSRQLPPTAFFQTETEIEDEESTSATDLESVLDACASRGVPRRRLLWHYRSRHESLIAFSNRSFYENTLVTFPSVAESRAVEFRHVPDAIYERGSGTNREEAKAVAAAVFEQLKREPDLSVGVGTFGMKQREAVQDALEERRREDPSLEAHFDLDHEDYCFVKNLESIQGDERDVIFISVGYGRDAGGKVSMNFGPLNQEGGDRRLNVLVTRARHKVVVFSSIKSEDFDLSKTPSRGVALLKKYLDYAERGVSVLGEKEEERLANTGLASAVEKALAAKGLKVAPRVGVSSFRVDVGVPDGDRFVLGVECDGDGDLACRTARDRYRLRRQVLEARGWTVHRVWALDWWRQPGREVGRIEEAVKAAKEAQGSAPKPEASRETQPRTTERQETKTNAKETSPNTKETPGIPAYVTKPPARRGRPEEFFEVTAAAVARALIEIVKVEGPIHRLEATRRVAAEWGVTKALKKVRDAADDGIDAAVASGAVKLKEDFLWPAAMATPVVRSRRDYEDGRDIDYVAVEEIAEAAALVLKKEFRLGREGLVAQALWVLGFDRPSARAKERGEAGVEALVAGARASEEDGMIKLK